MPFDASNYPAQDRTIQLLRDTRQKLSNPETWVRGRWTNWGSKRDQVLAFCVEGALLSVLHVSNVDILSENWRDTVTPRCHDDFLDTTYYLARAVQETLWYKRVGVRVCVRTYHVDVVTSYNDARGRRHEQILALIDRAIQLREQDVLNQAEVTVS